MVSPGMSRWAARQRPPGPLLGWAAVGVGFVSGFLEHQMVAERGEKSPSKIKAESFTWSCDPQVVWAVAQEGAAQNKIPGGDVERGLRRAFGFGRRACSSPHTAQPEELCRGLGWERGLCLPQPLAGTLGLASCRDFPAAVEFAAVTAGILLHAAQAQSSQTGIARCCKEGKKSFLHYRSPTTRSHLPASLQHFRILLNILMEKHTRAVGCFFF